MANEVSVLAVLPDGRWVELTTLAQVRDLMMLHRAWRRGWRPDGVPGS